MLSCLFLTAILINSVESVGVKCFCDRDSCDDNLLCQGEFCYIGLDRNSNGDTPRLRQHCGPASDVAFLSGPIAQCEQRIDSWQEVCRCEEDFCNTFAFLRSSIDNQPEKSNFEFSQVNNIAPISHANDRAPGPGRPNGSSLIVLLVIIPLSVGGFAVCLIFLNYHCKMC